MAGQGSVAYMFDRIGEIKVKGKGGSEDEETLELIDLGAQDIESFEEDGIRKYLVYVESPELNTMSNKITRVGYGVEAAEIVYKPNVTVQISDKETAEKVLDFAAKLEDSEDVQKVYANFDIPEDFL